MEASMRPVSESQKDDCLFCGRFAVNEAVCGEGIFSAAIRCCDSKECQKRAKQTAMAECAAMTKTWNALRSAKEQ